MVIKYLHVLTALLSISLFVVRFARFSKATGPRSNWLRVLPHVNDTLLLILAILMCFVIRQAPLLTPWLTEKLAAVILYIVAGMFALKWAISRRAQVIWFIIAIGMFAFAANMAVHKTPLML